MAERYDVAVVGAGAAGVFAALRAKELDRSLRLVILERSSQPLRKVSISGGGRCNVTHACDDLDRLLAAYPRGGYRLEPILSRFMPADTVEWFRKRGVRLKRESDGRMFPVTDSSQTVIDCLLSECRRLKVELRTGVRVDGLRHGTRGFRLDGAGIECSRLLLATGGASRATSWLRELGHEIVADIPSLFTFCCRHPVLDGLQGLSVSDTVLTLRTDPVYETDGPLLITHWGLSGPAVLKLSAFAARTLAEKGYRAELVCDLLPALEDEEMVTSLRRLDGASRVSTASPFPQLPKRLWKRLVSQAGLRPTTTWKNLRDADAEQLAATVKRLSLTISGKGVFKEEFVTAGGLPLREVDVYTMESRRVPGLYVAGELLDVDGLTGGFNFQNAWATGYVAGEALSAGVT